MTYVPYWINSFDLCTVSVIHDTIKWSSNGEQQLDFTLLRACHQTSLL